MLTMCYEYEYKHPFMSFIFLLNATLLNYFELRKEKIPEQSFALALYSKLWVQPK